MTGTVETTRALPITHRMDPGEGGPPVPERLGRYELRGELGHGMMGVVYDAYDTALGRSIALKTVRLAFAVSAADREAFDKRFFAEARIAAHLSHPGIVVVHDVGRDPESGILYIALERLPGRTLAEIIKDDGGMEWRAALRIVRGVAVALHHAHSHGVIHRDVKPANIMILPSGEPKIMDFGIAHLETAQSKLTVPGQFMGTPLYMSPEQTLGGPLDPRADVFSLGAIAYTLIAGRLAFGGGTLTRIIDRVVHEDPPPPSRFAEGVPVEVDYVVSRALAKSPVNRYLDAQSLAEDVDDVLAGRPPRHQGVWRRPSPEAGRRGAGSGAAGDGLPVVSLEETRAIAGAELDSPIAAAVDAPTPRKMGARHWRRMGPAAALVIALAALAHHAEPEPTLKAAVAVAPAVVPKSREGDRPDPQSEAPAGTPTDIPTLPRPSAGPVTARPSPRLARQTAATPVPKGRLDVDFRHPLRNGKLRIWVDEQLVLDQSVEGEVKSLLGMKRYSGSMVSQVEVSPKTHVIRVEVGWDDDRKAGLISASFQPGATRRLQIRLGRVPRDLSLELI